MANGWSGQSGQPVPRHVDAVPKKWQENVTTLNMAEESALELPWWVDFVILMVVKVIVWYCYGKIVCITNDFQPRWYQTHFKFQIFTNIHEINEYTLSMEKIICLVWWDLPLRKVTDEMVRISWKAHIKSVVVAYIFCIFRILVLQRTYLL